MTKKRLFRVMIFILLSGGLIYWLAGSKLDSSASDILGTGTEQQTDQNKPEIKGSTTDGQIQPDSAQVKATKQIIIKQIEKIKKDFLPQGKEKVEKTEVYKEIEDKIEETNLDLQQFPEKHKKKLEKEIIRSVCDHLIEQVDENE